MGAHATGLDLQLSYLDVASAGPTLRAGMAAEYRARDSQSFGVAGSWRPDMDERDTRLATRFAAFTGADLTKCFHARHR